MKKVFYEKVGRRYVPVSEYDSDYLDSFPKGNHLVMVYPGGSSRRYNIDPALAPLLAAARVAEDAVSKAIAEAMDLRPSKQPITEEQRDLWQALARSFQQDDFPIIRPAARDATDAARDALIAEAEKLLNNPSVRKAYERFLLMAELAKEKSNV